MLKKDAPVRFWVNGALQDLSDAPSDMHLAHYLREEMGLTGTRVGCSIGECRACTVMVRHAPGDVPVTKQSCMIALRHVSGWEVTTIEGIATPTDDLHPIQQAILDEDAMQCGYCAAGFVVAGVVAVEQMRFDPSQDTDRLVEAVTGHNLCRCTGYTRYRRAITHVVNFHARGQRAELLERPMRETMSADLQSDLSYVPLFQDPLLDLTRLLRDAAEIEHSLLVQYLFAAFSIKVPQYLSLAGWPSHRYGGRPLHMLGVAIEEMTHLDTVNSLLVALNSSPHLGRQQFPYEQDIYPFAFKLEPLRLESVAKYVYVEAPADAVDPTKPHDPADQAFVVHLGAVLATISGTSRPNHVGSLYRKIEAVLDQVQLRQPHLIDYPGWRKKLQDIRLEGEGEHFQLFKSLFDGTHPALPGPEVWDPANPDFPSHDLQVETGIPPAGQDVPSELLPALRHLANLHYWTVCMLLDQSYRRNGRLHNAARRHMTGPVRSLATELATNGQGVPFDVLPMGYAFGKDQRHNLSLLRLMLKEIVYAEERFTAFLPVDYSRRCALETAQELAVVTGSTS